MKFPNKSQLKKLLFCTIVCVMLVVCASSAGCTSTINSVVQIVEPVVGSWDSDLGTSHLYLNADGTGTQSVIGLTSSVTWNKLADGVYSIGGSRYTLSGNTLKGPIATYHRS